MRRVPTPNSKFFWPFTFMRNGQGNFGLDEERSPSATDWGLADDLHLVLWIKLVPAVLITRGSEGTRGMESNER